MDGDAQPLRLRAIDAEDLKVISTCLQDALVLVSDMAYLAEENRFVLVGNRFVWENLTHPSRQREEGPVFERILTGLIFDRVSRVQRIGFDIAAEQLGPANDTSSVVSSTAPGAPVEEPPTSGRMLNLLAIEIDETAPSPVIQLIFAANAAIRVEVSEILCHLQDIGEAWPTTWQPNHDEGL